MCRRPTILKSQRYLRPAGGRESVRNMKQFVLKGGADGGGGEGSNEVTTTLTDFEAELRYHQRRKKKTPKPPVTMASIQIDFIIQLRKNRPLMKNWFTCQKFINMGEKQMKNMVMSLALVMHAGTSFAGNNNRTKELGVGLSQILALIVVPFIIPPGVVIGIPTIIVFMPIVLLVWAFVTLNRRANKILWSRRNRRNPRRQRQSVGQRVSTLMKQATGQLSFRTTSNNQKKKKDGGSNKNTFWRSRGRNSSSSSSGEASRQSSPRPREVSEDDTASISDDSFGPSCAYPSTSDYNKRHTKAASSRFASPIFSGKIFKNTSSSSSRTSSPVPRSKTWAPPSSSLSSISFLTTSSKNNKPPTKLRSKSWPSFGRSKRSS